MEREIAYAAMEVTVKLVEPMLGTAPKNKEVYKTYIAEKAKGRHPEVDPEEEAKDIQEVEEGGWSGFRTDEKGPHICDFMVKGFLKEAGDCLKGQHGIKQHRSKIDRFVYVYPRKIYFQFDGDKTKKKPDGVMERPIRAMTMQGPRVTLKRSDYVEGITMTFRIEVVDNNDVGLDDIKFLLKMGERQGFGEWRNGGWGRFKVAELKMLP